MLWLVLAAVVGLVSALVAHEIGHVTAARMVGGRVERVEWSGLGARVTADVPAGWQQATFLLAGAGANVVVAVATAALAFGAGSSTMGVGVGLVAGMHALHALFALVPSGTSDGARLLAWWRERRS
jgi:membrane-associated protease RseP (regulator of RpoE activity)